METSWLSKAIVFNPAIISESDRTIQGVATSSIFDRENESITKGAVEKTLPYFMEIPVLHLSHTERPVGIVTKAEFVDSDKLFVEAKIGKSIACDDVWRDIKSGKLNAFSIYGRRIDSTCKGDGSLCVTKGMFLDSISICSIPVNPEATFVVKGEEMAEENPKEETQIEKSDVNHVETKLDELTNIVKSLSESINKMTVEKSEDKKKKEDDEELREIERSGDDVKKSMDEIKTMIKSLEERVASIENAPMVQKGVITIDESGAPVDTPQVAPSPALRAYVSHIYKGSTL